MRLLKEIPGSVNNKRHLSDWLIREAWEKGLAIAAIGKPKILTRLSSIYRNLTINCGERQITILEKSIPLRTASQILSGFIWHKPHVWFMIFKDSDTTALRKIVSECQDSNKLDILINQYALLHIDPVDNDLLFFGEDHAQELAGSFQDNHRNR